uniref:IgGFc_binding domain-containing protein n=1 Tax=Elaeophora elaphi TaxID=1147741 RepID=A0A0R3S1B5_9BILA
MDSGVYHNSCEVEIRLHLIMSILLCILFASNTYGQISLKKTNENEIFDVSFGKLVAEVDHPGFSNNDQASMSKFGRVRNEQDDGILDNLKKADGINNQGLFGKLSSENDMMSVPSSDKMMGKVALPVFDGALMVAAGKTTEEMVKELRDKKIKSASTGIDQTNGIMSPSQMNAFLHSAADGNAVEKLVQDSNFIHVKENSNFSEPRIENSLQFLTFNAPISDLKIKAATDDPILNDLDYTTGNLPDSSITWSNPQIFVKPIHIAKFHPGAHDTFNSSIEFICMLPEVVFCVTDLLNNDSYQLRIVYTSTRSTTNFNLPLTIRTRSQGGNSYTSWNASIHFVSDDLNSDEKMQSGTPSVKTQQAAEHQAKTMTDNEFHVQPNFIASEEQSVSIWNESTIQPEKATRKPAPVFILMPHFEHNSYEIYVPEGKNKESMIVAMVYFLTHVSDVETKFSIQSEPLQWFYLGEMEKETSANRLIIAIKLMLHDGADVDFRKTNNGQYKFQIKANQGSFETSTDINVEVLTFATKGTSHSSAVTTNSSATETALMMDEFTTPKFLTDSEHNTTTDSTDVSTNGPGIITVTVPNLEQTDIDTTTSHEQIELANSTSGTSGKTFIEKLANAQELKTTGSVVKIHGPPELSRLTVSRSEQPVERVSSFPEESPILENFAETFQSTVHEINTAESKSTTEKGSGGSFFVRVKEIRQHQSKSVTEESPPSINTPLFEESFKQLSRKATENWTNIPFEEMLNRKQSTDEFELLRKHEIVAVTLPDSFRNDLNAHYNSVSPESGTSVTTEIRRNALITEVSDSSKDSQFNESNDGNAQEELPVNNKPTATVLSSFQSEDSSFPNVSVEDRRIMPDKSGKFLVSMTTIPVVRNDGRVDNLRWSYQDEEHVGENLGEFAPNFKTNADILLYHATTTELTDLTTDELPNTNTDVDNDDTSYTDSALNTSTENNRYTSSTHINSVTWKDHIDHINTIANRLDTTVTPSDATATVDIDRSVNAAIPQQTSISLTDNTHTNSDYEMNESWDQRVDEKSGIDESQRTQLISQKTDRDKTTVAIILHPETVRMGNKAKGEWHEEDDSVKNGFRVDEVGSQKATIDVKFKSIEGGKYVLPNEFRDFDILPDLDIIITADNMASFRKSGDPNDVIMVSVNSSALEVIPCRMQPGKTVFLAVRDAEKLNHDLLDGSVLVKVKFAVNDGTVSVSCPSVLPCLDREQTTAYHLLAIVTDRNGLNSAPAIVKIYVDDRNDNGPMLETSQDEITISNGRLIKPFIVKVKDNDVAPHNINEISIDGTASAFISLEKVRDNIYYGRLWSLPAAGIYQLIITARDPDANIPEQKITVNVQVLNTVAKAHFKRAKYERTVNTEKLFKGNPILQPELENAPVDALRFILLRDDPGWLSVDEYTGNVIVGDVPRTGIVSGKYSISIAAVNRTDGRLITESVLVLTVISDNHGKKLFSKKLIVKILRKEPAASRQMVEIFPEQKASVTIIRDSISAVDEQLHYAHIDKNAISNSHGMIIMDMKRLQQIRMVQFNLSSRENANDSAKVILFLSSEPVEMAHERRRQAQPRFGHPWRSDMNIIPIKLAENSPEGYTIISLPAYNPMNGTKIMDLRLSGEMAQHFSVDGRSGDVQVVTPFDFEAMEPESHIFDLLLIAGEEPYDTVAVLRVEIVDVDDNPPKIAKFGDYNFENLKIAENSRPGTVLFEVQVSDPDYLYGKTGVFSYALSGNGAANFQVKKINDTVAVIVSPAADLDREKVEEMIVLLKVTDSGGNSDSVAGMITIIDVNDNVPVFVHNEYKVEAVENWPEAMVLTYVHAEDKDKGLNADIRYSLSPKNNQYFEIDPISGLIRAKKALIGLARAHPYDFSVVASDQGVPPLSVSAAVSIHVLESTSLSHAGDDKGVHIVSPSVHFTLQLDENTPANDRVYSVRAKIGGFNEQFGREIKYSITPVDNATDGEWFTIDTHSGDLFTLQELDHERQPAVTVSVF